MEFDTYATIINTRRFVHFLVMVMMIKMLIFRRQIWC